MKIGYGHFDFIDEKPNKIINFLHEKFILKHFFCGDEFIFIISSFKDTFKKRNFHFIILPYCKTIA